MADKRRKYQNVKPLRMEIDQLQRIIDQLQADRSRCRCSEAIRIYAEMIRRQRERRNNLISEYNAIIDELEMIKAKDLEVYRFLFWHDVNGLTWHQAFNKVCPDLIYAEPEGYAKKRVRRFLAKWEKKKIS